MTLLTRLYSVYLCHCKRWKSRKERRSLLKGDPSTEQQPTYTDENAGPAAAPIDYTSTQDIELNTIASLSQPEAIVHQPASEPESSKSHANFLMSGALATRSENPDEEPDAPLPLVRGA